MQLGLSRNWPEDVEAVKRLRAAFNVHIAKSLGTQCNLQAQAFPDYVDVAKVRMDTECEIDMNLCC